MPRVALFGLGKRGKSVTVSSQQNINLFPEISDQPDRSILAIYPTPGLLLFTDFGDTPVRGMHSVGALLYVVHRGTFWEVNNAGAQTSRGTIATTSGLVSMADNGNQVMIVDGLDGWIFNRTTLAFTKITDIDFPDATTCIFADSFFIVDDPANPGRFQKSAPFDGLSWDPLDFATAEYAPDALVNIFTHQGFLGLLGEATIEAWQNVGRLAFPYTRVSGAVIEWGLAAKRSIAKYDNSFMFLAKNRLGGRQVVLVENYVPKVISGPDMDAELAKYATVADAVAFSYFDSGHSFYHISFPTAAKSWIYDLMAEAWTEVRSSGGRHRAALGVSFIERIMVSDYENGKIHEMHSKYLDDNGMVIEREIISRHTFGELRHTVRNLWLDVEPATGTAASPNPQAVLTVSRDGGNTFGVGIPATIGRVGEYLIRCRWPKLGRARDWVFKFRVTDRVRLVITGAWMNSVEP